MCHPWTVGLQYDFIRLDHDCGLQTCIYSRFFNNSSRCYLHSSCSSPSFARWRRIELLTHRDLLTLEEWTVSLEWSTELLRVALLSQDCTESNLQKQENIQLFPTRKRAQEVWSGGLQWARDSFLQCAVCEVEVTNSLFGWKVLSQWQRHGKTNPPFGPWSHWLANEQLISRKGRASAGISQIFGTRSLAIVNCPSLLCPVASSS